MEGLIEEAQDSFKVIENKLHEQEKGFSSFKAKIEEKVHWHWILFGIIGAIVGHYFLSILPAMNNFDKRLNTLETNNITKQQIINAKQ